MSPQFTHRLLLLTLETLYEISRIRHGPNHPRPLGRMRVGVDSLNGRLLARLSAPPIRVRDEEQLVLREEFEAGQVQVQQWRLCGAFLPRGKRGSHTACVGYVFAQGELPVDVQGFAVAAFDGEVVVLIDEALGAVFEVGHGLVGPPVRVVAVLVVVAARRVEGVRELVPADRPEGAVAEVLRHVDVEDGELHYTCREDDLVTWWVVVCNE